MTSMEGHWKFLGGGRLLKDKIFAAKSEAKLEITGGRGCKSFHGGGGGEYLLDIFWNCTFKCDTKISLKNLCLAFSTLKDV